MVNDQDLSTGREFNHYSAYDWTTWVVYGSSPFVQQKRDQVKNDEQSICSMKEDYNASGPSTGNLTPPAAEILTQEAPLSRKKYELRAPIKAAEASPAEKQFFESLGAVLSNSVVGFFMGSSLAYILESRKSSLIAAAVFKGETSSSEAHHVPAKSSSLQTADAYQRAVSSNLVKPEFRGVEDLARRVAMKGAQTAVLAAAFTVTLEVNDHYLQRKRDPAAYAVGGALAGFVHSLVSLPFAPVSMVRKVAVMGAIGVAFSFAQEFLDTTIVESSP